MKEDLPHFENKFASINSAIYTTYSYQDDSEHENDDDLVVINNSNERVTILFSDLLQFMVKYCW